MRPAPFAFSFSFALAVIFVSTAESRGYKSLRRVQTSPEIQASQADLVVVGQITTIESEILEEESYPGTPKVKHLTAVLKVHDTLLGGGGLTHVRVGFVATPHNNMAYSSDGEFFQANGRLGRYNSGLIPQPRPGDEGCYFLKKHHAADFYVYVPNGAPVIKDYFTFDDEVDQVKRAIKVVRSPIEALTTGETRDRQFAALLLLHKHREAPVGLKSKHEPISQEESKLILSHLAEMNWGEINFDPMGMLSVQTLFNQLALTEKDGWKQPMIKDGDDYNTVMGDAFKKWCRENGSKYRIQRCVPEANSPMQ